MYIFCTLPCHGVIQGGWKWIVSWWRLSDQLMLHARKCYIVHAWVLHVHLHTCVYFVSSTYIYLLCSVKRDASVQCACILYNHACMHFTKCFGCAVVSWCPVYPVHVVWQWCTAAAGGVKLVVCAIVYNRNAVVCPCLCTVEASHFCVWMCLSYFSSIMRCSTKKGPHFHQHYFHHRRHRTSSTVDLHVSFVQFAALHSFCIS